VTFAPKVGALFCERRNNNVEYIMMMLIVFDIYYNLAISILGTGATPERRRRVFETLTMGDK